MQYNTSHKLPNNPSAINITFLNYNDMQNNGDIIKAFTIIFHLLARLYNIMKSTYATP